MPFYIVRQDITRMGTDAIVNAANTELLPGGGVCGAIFSRAGYSSLNSACQKLAPIRTGEAVITPGFQLPARFIIHTAGPIYNKSQPEESKKLLEDSYRNSLALAEKKRLKSIAFPLISSGIYGYPKKEAFSVAAQTIEDFLKDSDMNVYLTVFDRDAYEISQELRDDIQSFIDQHYVDTSLRFESTRLQPSAAPEIREDLAELKPMVSEDFITKKAVLYESEQEPEIPLSLDDYLSARNRKARTFSKVLLSVIDEKGLKDADVYHRANIDRKLFSKIRSGKTSQPKKATVLALAVALELDLEETRELLESAGYAFNNSSLFDLIVQYFIEKRVFSVLEINKALFSYDQPLLGSAVRS